MTFNISKILVAGFFRSCISCLCYQHLTGKGIWRLTQQLTKIQNYVLGEIISGVIYNSSITILQYAVILIMWTVLVFSSGFLLNNVGFCKMIDGKPTLLIKNEIDQKPAVLSAYQLSDVALKLRSQVSST